MSACGGSEGNCGGGGCQQQAPQQQQAGSFGSWARRHGTDTDATNRTAAHQAAAAGVQQQQTTCMKCKGAPAVTTIRQNEPYCHACIEAGVQQKARYATKAMGVISTGDRALLALSGGAASAALLYCMQQMQATNSQRPGRGKVDFGLTALHIDCSLQSYSPGTGSSAGEQQTQQLQAQLASLAAAAGCSQQPLLLHLSDVFCTDQKLQQLLTSQQQQQQHGTQQSPTAQEDEQQQQQQHNSQQHLPHLEPARLQRLLDLQSAVTDPTGLEDLLSCMRDQLLLRAAAALGCSRLLRGDSASRMAVRIISEAAKGRGFSLPADIQCFDARQAPHGGPCVLQPLREVTHKELRELCTYKDLPLLQEAGSNGLVTQPNGRERTAAHNVNVLAERFVQEIEGSLPASIYTIIRTASHLQPFGFTDAAAVVPAAAEAISKQQRTKQAASKQRAGGTPCNDSRLVWRLCRVCQAPLPDQPQAAAAEGPGDGSAVAAANSHSSGATSADSSSSSSSVLGGSKVLCYSCNRQVLQQVKLEQTGVAESAPSAGGSNTPGAAAAASLQEKMRRLKQLLPPGLLLESDSEGEV